MVCVCGCVSMLSWLWVEEKRNDTSLFVLRVWSDERFLGLRWIPVGVVDSDGGSCMAGLHRVDVRDNLRIYFVRGVG